MSPLTGSWQPIALLIVIAMLLGWRRLPMLLPTLLLAGGGAYLLYRGWRGWTGRASDSHITYWRGRRIEFNPSSAPNGQARLSAGTLLSLAAGALLVALALSTVI